MIALAALLAVATAQAEVQRPQQAPPQVQAPAEGQTLPVLTLEDALAAAREKNLDLQMAQARLRQSQEISKQVWANYLPTVSVGGSYTLNQFESVIDFGKMLPIPGLPPQDPIEIQKKHLFAGRVSVNQALIVPSLWPAIANAYLTEDVAALNVESARRDVLFGVAQLYYGAASLKEVVAVQRRLLDNNLAHERDARVRFEAGALPRIGVLRAEIDRARSEQDLRRAENNYASAKLSLATLLVRDANFDVARPEEPPPPPENLDQLLASADEKRPDLKAARENQRLAERQHDAVWYSYAPAVFANWTYQTSNTAGLAGHASFWMLSVAVNWTLWDGGLRESNLRMASAKSAEAEAARHQAELRAHEEVERSLLDLQSARANRTKAEEQLRLARENRQLVEVNFQSGVATPLDVSDAQAALAGAELGFVTETLNAQLAAVRLLKAMGAFAN